MIKSLESLEICGGGISDIGCTILATLDNLTVLNLSQNDRITNRGAAALAALSNLKALNLSNTRVNTGALVHFSDMIELKSIALYGCRGLTDNNGLVELQGSLPNLKCVRLNTGLDKDDDGIIPENPDDSDDDCNNDDDGYNFQDGHGTDGFHDSESDSEMEDILSQHSGDEDDSLEHGSED
jgi:hypothetical protein